VAKKTLLEVFAENLRVERARAKLTQQDVAEKAEISISYVSMLERGERSPPLDTLEKIAKALKLAPAALISRAA